MIKLRTQNDGHSFRGCNKYIKKDLDELFAMCTFNSSLDVWQMSRNRTKELNYGYTISISQPEFNSNYCEMFSNNFYGATDYLPKDTEIDYNQVKLPFSIKIEEQNCLTAHFYFLINSDYPFYPPKVFNIDEVRNDFIDERSGLVSLSWLCEEWTPAITLSIIIEQLVYFVCPPKEIRDFIDFTQSINLKNNTNTFDQSNDYYKPKQDLIGRKRKFCDIETDSDSHFSDIGYSSNESSCNSDFISFNNPFSKSDVVTINPFKPIEKSQSKQSEFIYQSKRSKK